jgi:hypothetical protein
VLAIGLATSFQGSRSATVFEREVRREQKFTNLLKRSVRRRMIRCSMTRNGARAVHAAWSKRWGSTAVRLGETPPDV